MRAVSSICLATLVACSRSPASTERAPDPTPPLPAPASRTFAERRAALTTRLLKHGPSPQAFAPEDPPPGVEAVRYPSGALELGAWFARPAGAAPATRLPVLVYFHGGYAFDGSDFEVARPFLDAGFAVMTPTLRGENGNPGDHEFFYGELDDARAAVAWVRARPDIDAERVFTFGHSAGGVLSAMLAFYPASGVRLSGSAAGLYSTEILAGREPFDTANPEESALRVPAPNADQFRTPHIAYVGDHDAMVLKGAPLAFALARRAGAPLTIEAIPGDHRQMLEPAVRRYLAAVQRSLAPR